MYAQVPPHGGGHLSWVEPDQQSVLHLPQQQRLTAQITALHYQGPLGGFSLIMTIYDWAICAHENRNQRLLLNV